MSDKPDPRTRYRIEALAKGLQVLSLFTAERSALRVTDIAELTNMPMPTAYRVVATLAEFDYVERLPDGTIGPGLAVLTLGTAAVRSSSLIEASSRPLQRLAETTGETVNLGVLRGDRVLYVARLRNRDIVTANLQVGSTLPAPYTSMGKVLLAWLSSEQLAEVITAESFPNEAGPRAIHGVRKLRPELAKVAEQGYATQDEELTAGLRSIAVPVVSQTGSVVAAVNVAVSTTRYESSDLPDTFLAALQATSNEIALRLQES